MFTMDDACKLSPVPNNRNIFTAHSLSFPVFLGRAKLETKNILWFLTFSKRSNLLWLSAKKAKEGGKPSMCTKHAQILAFIYILVLSQFYISKKMRHQMFPFFKK
jgi:hypothetical protein